MAGLVWRWKLGLAFDDLVELCSSTLSARDSGSIAPAEQGLFYVSRSHLHKSEIFMFAVVTAAVNRPCPLFVVHRHCISASVVSAPVHFRLSLCTIDHWPNANHTVRNMFDQENISIIIVALEAGVYGL